MATRKPDWAQRMVDNAMLGIPTYMAVRTNYQDCPAEYEPKAVVLAIDYEKYAAALLRTHHRKVKRMVQEVIREHRKVMALIVNDRWVDRLPVEGGIEACGDILDKLKELEQ